MYNQQEQNIADLHIHTNYSDGAFSPQEVVELASKSGLKVISVTDHDSVAAFTETQKAGNYLGIKVLPGCEISCTENEREFHILAYCFNHKDEFFTTKLTELKQMRIERAIAICKKLHTLKINIDIDDLLHSTKSATLTRMHIARELVNKNYVESTREAFSKYLFDYGPAYEPKVDFSVADAIKMIHSAGGVASLAHPGKRTSNRDLYRFITSGLDAIEIVHPEHNSSMQAKYENLAKQYNILTSGGSDFHGSRDWERYIFGSFAISDDKVRLLEQKAMTYK